MTMGALCRRGFKILSSETVLDDEDCMHFTLSQSLRSKTRNPSRSSSLETTALGNGRRRPHSAVGLRLTSTILLTMTGALIGCDGSTVSDREADSRAGARMHASAEETKASATFVWPKDAGHPLLILEIESDPGQGTIMIELMPELAPVTVAHVIDLAQQEYYDGTTFHRVIPGFMIQGGDPNSRDRNPDNDGQGNPGVSVADEFGRAPFVRGVVGMGNKGRRNSTGGQFFIMHADNHSLDGRYTVIGRVVTGMDVVDSIMGVRVDRIGRWGPKDRPIENVGNSSLNTLADL
jgi:peptidyl-prolyl cis-trans isomerase B (cyclophilin B)